MSLLSTVMLRQESARGCLCIWVLSGKGPCGGAVDDVPRLICLAVWDSGGGSPQNFPIAHKYLQDTSLILLPG